MALWHDRGISGFGQNRECQLPDQLLTRPGLDLSFHTYRMGLTAKPQSGCPDQNTLQALALYCAKDKN